MKINAEKRSGFTLVELMLTLGVITLSAGTAVPMYRQYIVRNDLEIARQNIAQGIQRARFLSQVSMNDSGWGFSTDAVPGRGTLYMGDSFALRDSDFDEFYSVPGTISVSGLTEVAFTKIDGQPDNTGTITLTAMNGEQRMISVSVGETGNVSIPEDWITICVDPYGVNPQTIQVPDSLWEYYQTQGATLYACGEAPEDPEDPPETNEDVDIVIDDDTVEPQVPFTCTVTVLGAAITSGGVDLPVTMQVKLNNGWIDPFGTWTQAVTANINGAGSFTFTCPDSYPSGSEVDVKARSWRKKHWWDSGESNSHWVTSMTQLTESAHNDNIIVLQDGDAIPDVPGMDNQSSIEDFVSSYVDLDSGLMSMSGNQIIYLFELGTNNLSSDAADFQDLVLLVTFSEE